MIIKYLSLSLILFCSYKSTLCQLPDTSNSCTNMIETVSYFWKKDSLGNNGARLFAYKTLIQCKIDTTTAETLERKLGKPNMLRKTNKGVEFIYYYLDAKAMPNDFEMPYACWYISFMFSQDRRKLLAISEGDMDY